MEIAEDSEVATKENIDNRSVKGVYYNDTVTAVHLGDSNTNNHRTSEECQNITLSMLDSSSVPEDRIVTEKNGEDNKVMKNGEQVQLPDGSLDTADVYKSTDARGTNKPTSTVLTGESLDEKAVAKSLVSQVVQGAIGSVSQQIPGRQRRKESPERMPTLEERVDSFIAEQVEKDESQVAMPQQVGSDVDITVSETAPECNRTDEGTNGMMTHNCSMEGSEREKDTINLMANDKGAIDNATVRGKTNAERVQTNGNSITSKLKPSASCPKNEEMGDKQPVEYTMASDNSSDVLKDSISTEPVSKPQESQTEEKETTSCDNVKETPQDCSAMELCMDDLIPKVLDGSCPFESLPPINKKVVRIFVSSTFSDTKEERNAFMEHVYPNVARLCREKYGLEFQVYNYLTIYSEIPLNLFKDSEKDLQNIKVVDMRWGVPEQASDNHSTTELCIQEIKKCQQVSAGPNFVAILGNKYGYRPIPSNIGLEEFHTLAEIAKSQQNSRWNTVEEWYLKDENCNPPHYVLEAVSAKLKDYNNMENAELRKTAKNEWNSTEQILTETLRDMASKAHKAGKLTAEAMHKYFMSVTENEVHHGILASKQTTNETSLCIMRSIPDIEGCLKEPKAPKFIDITQDSVDTEAVINLDMLKKKKVPTVLQNENVININIDWHASGGNISLESVENIAIVDYAERFAEGSKELNIVNHKKYIDKLCDDFSHKLMKMVHAGGARNKEVYDDVLTEQLQHLHFAQLRSEVFEGREDVLNKVKAYLNSGANTPIAIYGNSGSGKTSVMAKVLDKMRHWTKTSSGNQKTITCVLRFLGTTPATSNVQDLLTSLCQQITKVYEVNWEEPDRFQTLVKEFHKVLANATKERPLLVLLDSIDQLLPSYDALNLKWLPKQLPPYVKMILSTIDEGYTIKDKLEDMYSPSESANFISVEPLGDQLGMSIIEKWLNQQNRCINKDQQALVMRALATCSLPLYARIAYNQISSWRSFDVLSEDDLETTIKGAINKLYQQMENKLGEMLVKHSLALFTAARYGLSEVEMEHLLSLDDDLLNDIYKFWKPPIRRIPPLLWTRVRNEINNYVVERSADNILVMNWYHRQFIEATRERYFRDESFVQYIHEILADFFSGKWGGGVEKPFEYSEAQKARFTLQSTKSQADRKVPVQPFQFTSSIDGKTNVRCNERKLSELPWHLMKSKQIDMLFKAVFFNYDWLYAKLKATSANAIIQEIEILSTSHTELNRNKELRILEATLQLIRPYITKYPESLAVELLGRLCQQIGTHHLLTHLASQCDWKGKEHSPILPIMTCFQTADLGLRQNINIRTTAPIEDSGGLTCTRDFKTMYVIDYDELGKGILSTFDVESGEKVNDLPLQKNGNEGVLDFYLDCRLTLDEKFLLAFYRLKYARGIKQSEEKYNWKAYSSEGFIDIVDVMNGKVVRTVKEFLYKDDFYNVVLYQTQNYIAVRFGWKIPLIYLHEDITKSLTECHCLTKDENYLALIRTKKDSLCKPTEEEEAKAKARSKTTIVRNFKTKELLAELERSDDMSGITITNDDKIAIVADFNGKLLMYGIKRIGGAKRNVKKIIGTLALPFYEKIKVFDQDRHNFKRVVLQVSPNDQFVCAIYQGRDGWEAFLWEIKSGKYIGRVTNVMELKARYPIFSFDSACLVVCFGSKVQLYSCLSACKARDYELGQTIRDIQVSTTSLDVAVLLSKDVVFLQADCEEKADERANTRGKIMASSAQSVVLMDKEILSQQQVHPGILFDKVQGKASEDHKTLDMDQLENFNSARSQKRSPIDSSITPDGLVAVQLLARVQVIDTQNDEIVCSPRNGDIILRPYTSPAGDVVNEEVALPSLGGVGMNQGNKELREGDRIMGEGNKVRYRCHGISPGQVKVMAVPSVLTISTLVDGELKRIHRITVYNESILTLSNKYLATAKKKGSVEFLNIYELESGKLIATHHVEGRCTAQCIYDNESKIAATNTSLTLKIYGDTGFVRCLRSVNLREKSSYQSVRMATREILSFPHNINSLVIRLSEEGLQSYGVSYYMHVNTETTDMSPLLAVKPKLEDISKDGSMAVDSHLALYSLPKGAIIKQIPYSNSNINMQLQVRISDDNKHVIFVDKQDDTLHVIKMESCGFHHLVSCHTHVPRMSSIDGLYLRQYGRVIVLKSASRLGLFVLTDPDVMGTKRNISYESELDRALSLIPRAVQDINRGLSKTLNLNQMTTSHEPVVQDFLSSLGSN